MFRIWVVVVVIYFGAAVLLHLHIHVPHLKFTIILEYFNRGELYKTQMLNLAPPAPKQSHIRTTPKV